MEFDNNRPIYLQICDAICERILSGELEEENRIPSVRDYGAEIEVNPNTVMRSYEKLTADGLIYNRRGIGYFICTDARKRVLEAQRKEFMEKDVPEFLRRMELLGIDPGSILTKKDILLMHLAPLTRGASCYTAELAVEVGTVAETCQFS